MTDEDDGFIEEEWRFKGKRWIEGKQRDAWIDESGDPYMFGGRNLPAYSAKIGATFSVIVRREDGGSTQMRGIPKLLRPTPQDDLAKQWAAEEYASKTHHNAVKLSRSSIELYGDMTLREHADHLATLRTRSQRAAYLGAVMDYLGW